MKLSKRSLVLFTLCSAALWAIFMILALTWRSYYDWPDFEHENYGFPLVWATHILNTIAGPVDVWKVDIMALSLDLLLWLGFMMTIIALMLFLHRKT